jgi:hypothetical protein
MERFDHNADIADITGETNWSAVQLNLLRMKWDVLNMIKPANTEPMQGIQNWP